MFCPDSIQTENSSREKCAEETENVAEEKTLKDSFSHAKKKWRNTFGKIFAGEPACNNSSVEGDNTSELYKKQYGSGEEPTQKWQSLGKMFRKSKDANQKHHSLDLDCHMQPGSSNHHTKRHGIKNFFTTYLNKFENSLKAPTRDAKVLDATDVAKNSAKQDSCTVVLPASNI